MTQDQVKLKPCPFCGSVDIRKRLDKYTDNNFYASLVCRECKAEALEDVWNQRTPAIDVCTIVLMKKCDGITKVIEETHCHIPESSLPRAFKKGLTMSDDQLNIEDAVKYFNGELREAQVTEIHAKPLVDLAQRYLSCSSMMPSKKEVGEIRYGGCNPDEDRGYNEATEACTLALMKKCEGLDANFFKQVMDKEGIRNNEENAGYIHTYSDLCSCGKCHMSYLLSSAIQQYLTGSGK